MPTLVDSHCHLDFPDFAGELDAVVRRAGEAGVATMLTICTRLSRFAEVLAVAERYHNVYCSVGVHPHEAEKEGEVAAARLLDLAGHPKVIGFGETGLDYYYEHSPREAQQRSFRAHIAAARAAGLPLIVHARDADGDVADILAEEQEKGRFPGLIHCFTGGCALAERALGLGFFISFSGIVTFKKADAVREIARDVVPLERALVETDAPYLAPGPHRGKRNEPAFTAVTTECLARIKGVPVEAVARATTDNFFRLFRKAKRPRDAAPCG
jgi:TatD DNase family protein